jgi:pimeloyl-ACP methyl ester carboxylesterase
MGIELTSTADRTEELAASGVPVLVACGANDDAWSPAEQRDMAARLGASFVELAGAGHSPAVDVPEVVASALADFWNQLESQRG